MGGGQGGVCWASPGFQFLNWELAVISALCPHQVCPDVFCFHPFARLLETQLGGMGVPASVRLAQGDRVGWGTRERERRVQVSVTVAG